MARAGFKQGVLAICSIRFHKNLREHTRGIKEHCPRCSGDPTSRIRSTTEEQILSHDENVEFSLNGGRRQGQMDGSEAISLC